MNIQVSQKIFATLHREGVRDIVFCPGARNSALIAVLSHTRGFETHSFFEERSAAFYALGIARRKGQPVAIITTSGTAVAELLAATIEAFHSGVPLILVTADRPRRMRGTGAPQAIQQVGIFSHFVSLEFDLEVSRNEGPENGLQIIEQLDLQTWNRRSPLHLNLCFEEPLLDEPISELVLQPLSATPSFTGRSEFALSSGLEWSSVRLTKFLRAPGPLITVVGSLETDSERHATLDFVRRIGAPVYLEGTSGLRDHPDLKDISLHSGDKLLAWALKRKLIARVLRIGAVPTVRIWRDLDEANSPVEVLSLSALPFSGLSRGELLCAEIAPVLNAVSFQRENLGSDVLSHGVYSAIFTKDRAASAVLKQLFIDEPLAEPSLFQKLTQLIPDSALVYVGNSLPIREWDLAADRKNNFAVEANRGVNGIDGQVATFLGLARSAVDNWAIIGDLTALYDLAGPWAFSCREDLRVRLVVINNGGGKIFSRIFNDPIFENRHQMQFEYWAKMWGFDYQRWIKIPENCSSSHRELVEVVPNSEATQRFWKIYDGIWT